MSNLEQLKITFEPIQDRLVLIFFTRDFTEFRFWLTRRMTKKFHGLLKQLQSTVIKSEVEKKYEEEKAQQNVQQEAVQQEASKYGMQLSRNPLGMEPLLLTQVKISADEQGRLMCRFESHTGNHIDFNMDTSFIVMLIQLIEKALPYTDWDLKFDDEEGRQLS